MFTDDTFEDTTVLITGGGTGIGRQMALAFAEHGATVGVTARREEPLQSTVDAIRERGGEASWRTVDLTDVRTGEAFTISQFEGRPVLLEFFAVWCPKCT
ncbi:MAG: SDR family NAD(P)-dependent oxidoreductase, partial [Bradymonadaceae bacterium]